jgi:ABC-type uncharacterized transport system permease subunit
VTTLTTVEVLAYAFASAFFLGNLFWPHPAAGRAGRIALGVGVVAQFVDIGARCVAGQNPVSSTPEAVAFVGFLVAAGYLGATFRYHLTAAGAFAVPAALILLLLGREAPAEPEARHMGALGRTHVFLATLGVAVFALAAVLAVLYLVQERRLKRKRLDRSAGDAPLALLDRLALRCVSVGFPIFTVALVTGAIWIGRLGGVSSVEAHRPEYFFAMAAWLAFGVLLVARVGAGWQGRRAAWLTLGGFGGTLLVLIAYLLRSAT